MKSLLDVSAPAAGKARRASRGGPAVLTILFTTAIISSAAGQSPGKPEPSSVDPAVYAAFNEATPSIDTNAANSASRTPQPRSIPSNCTVLGGNYIIQVVCAGNQLSSGTAPGSDLITNIEQFETDSVAQWLALFHLPNDAAGVSFFYQYGRGSIRNDVRAYMKLRLIDIGERLKNAGNTVTQNEQMVWQWFQARVQARKVAMDQDAVNDKNSWQGNRCGWKPDTDLEKVFGFNYIPCVGTEIFNTAPSKNYFIAAAKKRDYDNVLLGLTSSATPGATPAARGPILASASSPERFAPRDSSTKAATPSGPVLFSAQDDAGAHMLGILGGVTGGVLGTAVTTAVVSMSVPQIRYKIFPTRSARNNLENRRINRVNNAAKNQSAEEEVEDLSDAASKEAATEGDTVIAGEADELALAAAADTTGEVIADGAVEGAAAAVAQTITDGAAAGSIGGPVGVLVGVGIAVGIAVTTIVVDESQAEKSLGDLDSTLNADSSHPPDLLATQGDPLGQYQMGVTWTAITWPDVPSTAALPSPVANDAVIASWPNGQPANTTVNNVSFQGYGGVDWTVSGYGGWLLKDGSLQIPARVQTLLPPGSQNSILLTDISPTIDYLDWNGYPYWASRIGLGWIVGKRFVDNSDVDCPADATGVTTLADVSGCRTYVTATLQATGVKADGSTYQELVTVATPTAITPDSTTISFNTNELSRTFTVPVSGFPLPTVFVDPSTPLPNGITMRTAEVFQTNEVIAFDMNGYSIVPGTYTITLHAKNAGFDTTKTFTFNITGTDYASPPVFDDSTWSKESVNWITGIHVALAFHVTSGNNITFTEDFSLPPGMTFFWNYGKNTLQILGTPVGQTTNLIGGGKITGCDPFNRCAWIPFLYESDLAPAAHLTNPDNNLRFPENQFTQYTLHTVGAVTPVTFSTCFGPLPPWMTMTDNGNGSVTFAGTAPTSDGVNTVYETSLLVHTAGLPDPAATVGGPCSHNNMQILSDATPQIYLTSATITVRPTGGYGIFLPSSLGNDGTMSTNSPLPNGMAFYPPFESGGAWSIGGTPQPGSGGEYRITLTLANPGTNPVNQDFLLDVDEAPSFNLPPEVFFMAGMPNKYVVKPGGYPALAAMSVTENGALPAGVTFGNATELTAAAGTATIQGKPDPSTAKTTWTLNFTADNGIGTPATGSTLLHIVPAGDVTHDDVVDCNDVTLVKSAFGGKAGTSKYNGNADVNGDGIVNLLDLTYVTSHLSAGTSCH